MRHRSISNNSKYSGLTLLILGVVIVNDAAAAKGQLVQRFGDSAVQGFDSRMRGPAVQHFDNRMRNSQMQRFESRMMSSPVSHFESGMMNAAIQGFGSQMMYSPAQRVEGPRKPFRLLAFSFFSIRNLVEDTVQETEPPLELPSQPVAPPQFISLRCGLFTEMTIGESEILSEKENLPCHNSGEAGKE